MTRISEAVKDDHAIIKRAYRRLSDARPEDRNPDEFVWLLSRYLMVEDLVMTPALEHHVAQGGERHNKLTADYSSIHAKILHMKRYDPAEPSFESALKAIWVDLEPHIREEATGDLTRLEESLSLPESEALAKRYNDIKELLQKPYGENGTPDERTLSAILEMPRQDLLVKLGLREE